jgi:serine/threonine protein phosphatase PrpC
MFRAITSRIQNIDREYICTSKDDVIYNGIKTEQIGKGQDHVDHGTYNDTNGDRVDWAIVFDGHGNDSCIKRIRQANFQEIMKTPNPVISIQEYIDSDGITSTYDKIDSGATFICARMKKKAKNIEVEIMNVGDSIAIIHLNKQHIFTSEPHNYKNAKQMIKLIENGFVFANDPFVEIGSGFSIINNNTLCLKSNTVYVKIRAPEYPSGFINLSPTNFVGHNNIIGRVEPEITKFTFNEKDNISIVLMSDGVSDVIRTDGSEKIFIEARKASDIAHEAVKRWKQSWNCYMDTNYSVMHSDKFPKNGYDDCCSAMIKYTPITDAICEIVKPVSELIILETPISMPLKESNDESKMDTKQRANKQPRKKRVNKKKEKNEIPENITFEETSANV